jgi:membrane fusion protein, heavy metal efflux system
MTAVTSDPRRFTWRIVAAALIAGLIGGASVVWLFARPSVPPPAGAGHANAEETHAELPEGVVEVAAEAQRNAGVTVVPVITSDVQATLELTGTVEADVARVSQVRPLGRGVVQSLLVQVGEEVKRDQPLLTYDNIELGERISEFLSERATLRQAETDREVKRRAADRGEALFKTEAIAEQTLELRRAEFRSAEALVASGQARVARVEEQLHRFGLSDSDLERLAAGDGTVHRTNSQATLRSPIDGIITRQNVAVGELVDPARDLFTVANISTVWVQGDVYEKDINRIAPGVTVPIRVDAFPDRTFEGKLTYISDLIDPATRAAKVRCVVSNPQGMLKLDMFARLSIPTNERQTASVVPAEAVQRIDDKPVVFVQRPATPTRFERRDVTLGPTVGALTAVANGVKPGERVAAAGSFYLKTALLRERIGDEH